MSETDFTVVSIFVNPTQFDNVNDLKNYPKSIDEDVILLKRCGVDCLFLPTIDAMYPTDYRFQVHESKESELLEGKQRPGHFDGVLTVVMKLLSLVRPNVAYFGEKDFQQLSLIRDMVKAFFLDVNITACTTVRDTSCLAFSSRNNYLSQDGLLKAHEFARIFHQDLNLEDIRLHMKKMGIDIEYLHLHRDRVYIAVNIEGIRLIDNKPKLITPELLV